MAEIGRVCQNCGAEMDQMIFDPCEDCTESCKDFETCKQNPECWFCPRCSYFTANLSGYESLIYNDLPEIEQMPIKRTS